MKLLSHPGDGTTVNIYTIEHDGVSYKYTEYLKSNGKLIDQELEREDGDEIPDAVDQDELMDKFSDFVETASVE